jgi:hypothetical protein
MNRERAKGVLAFFALFLIGLAVYGVFDAALAPSKPMVQEEPQPTEGVSKVAAQVSPSVVGITSFKRGQRVFDGYDSESTGSGVNSWTIGPSRAKSSSASADPIHSLGVRMRIEPPQ